MQLFMHEGRQQQFIILQMPCIQRQNGVAVRDGVEPAVNDDLSRKEPAGEIKCGEQAL